MRGKLSFLQIGIWFDVTNCKFILKISNLKRWLCFLHILGYNIWLKEFLSLNVKLIIFQEVNNVTEILSFSRSFKVFIDLL